MSTQCDGDQGGYETMRYTCVLCHRKQASSRIRAHTVLGRDVCHTCVSKYDNQASLGSAVQSAILEGKHLHPMSGQRQPVLGPIAAFTHVSNEPASSVHGLRWSGKGWPK